MATKIVCVFCRIPTEISARPKTDREILAVVDAHLLLHVEQMCELPMCDYCEALPPTHTPCYAVDCYCDCSR